MAPVLLTVIAHWRNCIETTFSEITDLMDDRPYLLGPADPHCVATIAAHTPLRICFAVA